MPRGPVYRRSIRGRSGNPRPAVQTWAAGELRSAALVTLKLTAPAVLVLGVIAAGPSLATRVASDDRPVADRPENTTRSEVAAGTRGDDHSAIQGTWVASQRVTSMLAGKPLPPKDVPIVWKSTAITD